MDMFNLVLGSVNPITILGRVGSWELGAKSADGRGTRPVVLGFPRVEHLFKTDWETGCEIN